MQEQINQLNEKIKELDERFLDSVKTINLLNEQNKDLSARIAKLERQGTKLRPIGQGSN